MMISMSTPISPGRAENFDHASGGRETALGKARDLDVHDGAIEFRQAQAAVGTGSPVPSSAELLAQLGRQFLARGNQHFVMDARVVGQHVVAVRAVAEQAHERGILALDDLHDAAFGAAVGAAALDAREHAVAVHGVGEVVAADEEIAVDSRDRRIGNEESRSRRDARRCGPATRFGSCARFGG